MVFFLVIKYRQLVDETLIEIKIEFLPNEIHFKERLTIKQNLMKWSNLCLTRCICLPTLRIRHAIHFS